MGDRQRERAWKVSTRQGSRTSCTPSYGPVAQQVRAPPCHGGGRRFKSGPGRVVAYILKVGGSFTGTDGRYERSLLFVRTVESKPENR